MLSNTQFSSCKFFHVPSPPPLTAKLRVNASTLHSRIAMAGLSGPHCFFFSVPQVEITNLLLPRSQCSSQLPNQTLSSSTFTNVCPSPYDLSDFILQYMYLLIFMSTSPSIPSCNSYIVGSWRARTEVTDLCNSLDAKINISNVANS